MLPQIFLYLDTGNASSVPMSQRVPPLTIRIPRPEKPQKPTVSIPPVDTKFRCLLKLDRVDLSLYNISNLPISPPIKPKKSNEFLALSSSANNKTKSLTITKPHEHHKPLKRLNTIETKKQSSELSKNKRSNDSKSISSSTNGLTLSIPKNTTKQRSTSSSSMSPIYRPKPIGAFEKKMFPIEIFCFYSRKTSHQKESTTRSFTI